MNIDDEQNSPNDVIITSEDVHVVQPVVVQSTHVFSTSSSPILIGTATSITSTPLSAGLTSNFLNPLNATVVVNKITTATTTTNHHHHHHHEKPDNNGVKFTTSTEPAVPSAKSTVAETPVYVTAATTIGANTTTTTTTPTSRSIQNMFSGKMPHVVKSYKATLGVKIPRSSSKLYERSSSAGKIILSAAGRRRVSFPENDAELVTGYLEPANPWASGECCFF